MKEKIIIRCGDYVKLQKEEPLTHDRVRLNHYDTFKTLQTSGECIVKVINISTKEIVEGTWAFPRFNLLTSAPIYETYEIF